MIFEDERFDEVNENIRLIQKKHGLTFGTDAYLLSAYLRARPSERAVDLGSGTGIIPLLCMSRGKAAHFHALEIQPSFAELIQRNVTLNGFDDKITPICSDVRNVIASDVGGEVGIVTANPPYMKADSGQRNTNDEKFIARHEVAGSVYDFCAAAARLLKYGGRFYCVYRPDRLTDLMDAMRRVTLEPKRMTFVHSTVLSKPSMVLIEAQKGASPSMLITPPLCLSQPDCDGKPTNTPTAECDYIYENCAFPKQFLLENKLDK